MSERPYPPGSPPRDADSPMEYADHSHFLPVSGPSPWGPTTATSSGGNAGGGSVSSEGGAASPGGLTGAVSPTLSIHMGEVGTSYGHRMDIYPWRYIDIISILSSCV